LRSTTTPSLASRSPPPQSTQQRGQWLKDIAAKLDPPRAIIARWQRYAGPDKAARGQGSLPTRRLTTTEVNWC
jgi:hypothetical protein